MVRQLHRDDFIDGANNAVLIVGPCAGKTHIAPRSASRPPGDTYPPASLLSGNQHGRASRVSTLLELAAVHAGDIKLAQMNARYSRNIWHQRT